MGRRKLGASPLRLNDSGYVMRPDPGGSGVRARRYGMSEGMHPGADGDDLFEAIDPGLNVFALANGMDLSKGSGFRRLEWFTEGLERGILIEADGDAGFRLGVLSWPTGSTEIGARASVAGALSAEDLIGQLQAAIDTANEL